MEIGAADLEQAVSSKMTRLYGDYMATALLAMLASAYVFLWIARPLVSLAVTVFLSLVAVVIILTGGKQKKRSSSWQVMAEVVHNTLFFSLLLSATWAILAVTAILLVRLLDEDHSRYPSIRRFLDAIGSLSSEKKMRRKQHEK